ncbi:MAG: ATP-binding protein [Bdellovibrionales bacterium]
MFSLRLKKADDRQHTAPLFGNLNNDDVPRIAINADGDIVFASDAFLDLAHLSHDQIQNRAYDDVLHFNPAITAPRHITSGIHTVHINGHNRALTFQFDWVETAGKKHYLIGAHTTAHTDSDTTAQTAIDLTQELILTLDHSGTITSANTRMADLTGQSRSTLIGASFVDLCDEHDQPAIRNTLQTLKFCDHNRHAEPIEFEACLKTATEKPRCIAWRQHIKNDQIYVLGTDITAIKAQKHALILHQKRLEQAESLGRMGHWRWVLGTDTIEWSREIYRIFGTCEQTFSPTLESMNARIHRDDVDRLNQALQRAIIEENDYDVEFRITHENGETRYIRSEGRCSRNDEGEVTALFGIMQDITDHILHEQELMRTKNAAERAYAAKTQFLANMSHELRTPLNAILGFSEMIEKQLLGPIGNEKYLDYVKGIHESGEHLLDLISDILDMSKIEAGKYELMLEEVNVAKTLKLALHMIEGRALDSNIKIAPLSMDDQDLQIIADRRALLQMVLNILSNAIKFSKENGHITIECTARETAIAIKISDDGIGIPANKLATITRPFEQVSSSYARDHEGSGLGLAITKELAEMHGGALKIESQIDVGTAVTIRLPYEGKPTVSS